MKTFNSVPWGAGFEWTGGGEGGGLNKMVTLEEGGGKKYKV